MKLSHCAILLSSILFYTQISYAEINIEKCKPNKVEYTSFDLQDYEIGEKLINHVLHNQPEKRENTVIQIFANDNADDRKYWLMSFKFDDQSSQYLFYQAEQNKIIEIDQKQYNKLLPKVVECNQDKDVPIYSENFDAD